MRAISKKTIKKIAIIVMIIALIAAITCGGVFITAAVNHDKYDKYIASIPLEYGEVEFSDWSNGDVFNQNDYSAINAEGTAKILLFSDIHFGNLENLAGDLNIYKKQNKKIFKNLEKTVHAEKPDMLIFLGDIIASRDSANDMRKFGSFVDSLNVPWTYVFGNHEGDAALYKETDFFWLKADKAKLAEILLTFDNCLYRNGYSVKYQDGLYSIGNDLIKVNIDGAHVYDLYTLDSNSYIPPEYDYDSIRKEQVAWYEWAAKNAAMPNMVFMHMPIPQFENAFNSIGKKLDGTQPLDNGMFNKMKENSATDIFSGHLHGLQDDIMYDGINFHFAMTSSVKGLWVGKKAGYKTITIKSDGQTDVQNKVF